MTHNSTSAIYNRNEVPLAPFSNKSIHVEDSPFRVTNSNFRATNRGFSANRGKQGGGSMANQGYKNQFKDPEIWESPPPLEKRQSVQRVNKANSVRTNNIRNGPVKKKNGDKDEKKTFLNDRYPNGGSGPDQNLIEMLEKEVLDKSPNIQFDDIADL